MKNQNKPKQKPTFDYRALKKFWRKKKEICPLDIPFSICLLEISCIFSLVSCYNY